MTTQSTVIPEADQQRIDAIVARREAIRVEIDRLHAEDRALHADVRALMERNKPTYPTDEHRAGIAEAARRFREGTPAKSHHGDGCVPGEEGRASVVCAPHSAAFSGLPAEGHHFLNVRSRGTNISEGLWRFGTSDIAALIILLAEEHFEVVKHWPCDGGHSFIVKAAPHVHAPADDDGSHEQVCACGAYRARLMGVWSEWEDA